MIMENNKIVDAICYLGKNSIYVVIWQFLAFRFAIILEIIIARAPLHALTAFPVYDSSGGWFVIYLFVGTVVSLFIGKIMDKLVLNRVRIIANRVDGYFGKNINKNDLSKRHV